MIIETKGRALPFSSEQAFDLAADIERYPEFLRGWISARIRRREGDVCYVDQVLGLGPARVHFASKAVLHRPERIVVSSSEAPFRQFCLAWNFETVPNGVGCLVSLSAALDLRSTLLQRIIDRALPTAIADVVAAFETRAGLLYAPHAGPVETPAPRS